MSTVVYWIVELDVLPGQEDAVRSLMSEMVEATRKNEPGALNYEWSMSADGTRCHIYERYRDSAAVVTHMRSFGKHFARRFLEVLQPARLVVYGSPDEHARAALAPLEPLYLEAADGFAR